MERFFWHELVVDFLEGGVVSSKMLSSLLESNAGCDRRFMSYSFFLESVFRIIQGSLVAIQSLYEISLFFSKDGKA